MGRESQELAYDSDGLSAVSFDVRLSTRASAQSDPLAA